MKARTVPISLLFLCLSVTALFGQSPRREKDSLLTFDMPEVEIVGTKPGLIDKVPGSATVVTAEQLHAAAPLSGNEVLRAVPGLHAVDEEGGGFRLNLSIRGLDPDRSRTVLVLEDGVPVALAPYGEPEMYYTPAMDRMQGLEVLKGSGSIRFGPQTIGGVINYLTSDPPAHSEGSLRLTGGNGALATALARYGNTIGGIGVQMSLLRKSAENLGPTWYRINDASAKVKMRLDGSSVLGLKLAAYDEESNSTYVGLTQAMYDAGQYDARIAPDDLLKIRRYFVALSHDWHLGTFTMLKTNLYWYTTSRDWRRQDYSYSASASNRTGVVFGDTGVAGGAIYMRAGTGNRDRQFEVAGLEPRLSTEFEFGGTSHQLDAGARLLFERAFEQFVVGASPTAVGGATTQDEIRSGLAQNFFVQDRVSFGGRLTVIPGIRFENFTYERHIRRGSFRINNTTAVRDTSILGANSVSAVIPGLGLTYRAAEGLLLFAGAHRGFAPPRVKDAITNAGEVLHLDAETSWNYELGARTYPLPGLTAEATVFFLDFTNQIIPVSQSSGGAGTGYVNGGRTKHLGIEAALQLEISRPDEDRYGVSLESNATFVEATYGSDRHIVKSGITHNINGLRLPYAPSWHFSHTVNIEAPFGVSLHATLTQVTRQFADELNTVAPTVDGLVGEIPGTTMLDLTARYALPALHSSFVLAVKNATDARVIVSRRPSGIKVSLPRFVTAGVELSL